MDLDCKVQENRTKNILGDKQNTNKLPLIFLDAKLLMER